MPPATRMGDMCTGHGCYPSRPSVQGSPTVFVNGVALHRQGDAWASHCCSSCHGGALARGCPTVFANGVEAGRVGDPVSCGSHVAQGSPNVFIGGRA